MALLPVEMAGLQAKVDETMLPERYERFFACVERSIPIPDLGEESEKKAWTRVRKRLVVRYWLECEFQKQRSALLEARDPSTPPWKNWDETLATFRKTLQIIESSHLAANGTYQSLKPYIEAIIDLEDPRFGTLMEASRFWREFLGRLSTKRRALADCDRAISQPGLDRWDTHAAILRAMDAVYLWDDVGDYQAFVFAISGRLVDRNLLATDRDRLMKSSIRPCFERHFLDGEA